VTLKVFKLIGPYNDSRRHGRGTYLFSMQYNYLIVRYLVVYLGR
jgi:hypothetical protein